MRLASVLTPTSDENLTLAAQCGVECITIRYPGPDIETMRTLKERIESFGMSAEVIEGYLPIEHIKLGDDGYEADLEEFKTLLRNMGELGINRLCYNFMAGGDWARTRSTAIERGGAFVTAFNVNELDASLYGGLKPISTETLWANLERFLNDILPLAEETGVVLCMHPDDPPLPVILNQSRIMNSVENFERLLDLCPSPSNKMTFCQGTFAELGVNIPDTIRRLGEHIEFVHFRDTVGTPDNFRETFHDNGPTDMVAAMQAYKSIQYDGVARPDHVPQLAGEADGEPGYTMKGRLFAFGYMRGLMQATGFG